MQIFCQQKHDISFKCSIKRYLEARENSGRFLKQ